MSEVAANGITTSGDAEVVATPPAVETSPLKAVGKSGGDSAEASEKESTVIKTVIKNGGVSATASSATNGSEITSSTTEDEKSIKSPARSDSEAVSTTTEKGTPAKSDVSSATTEESAAAPEVISSTSEKKSPAEKGVSIATETKSTAAPATEVISSTTGNETDDAKSALKSPAKSIDVGELKSASEKEDDSEKDADYYLAHGKRDLTIRDYPSAVDFLSKACEKLSAIHGEFADELGDAYFLYGKALLASYREESGVLGDKIEKDQEGAGDDEEGEDDEEDGVAEGNATEEKSEELGSVNTPVEEEKAADNGTNEDGAAENGDAPEGDADDLQLSWQFLEMAKVIYARKADEDKEIGIKLSEVYLALGENGLESESYSTAVTDFETCLDLQKKNMAADDRRMAETLYQMGMAYGMMEKFEEAVTQFQASIAQLQKRLDTLDVAKKAGKQQPDGEKYDTFYSLDGEHDDITETIKEIRDKIADMHDYQKHLKEEVMRRLVGGGLGVPNPAAGESSSSASASAAPAPSPFEASAVATATVAVSTSKPVSTISNISHLVRKKRKNDDEPEKEEKKLKTDESASQ